MPQPTGSTDEDDATAGAASTASGDGGTSAAAASSAYVEELELLQVDLGDMIKIKQVLDEAVAGAMLDHVDEDLHWDNFKLTIMALACAFAMVAQFAPIPFPESRPVLGVCGSLYFLLSGVLQFIATFVDKDAILLTKPSPQSKNVTLQKYGLRVRSNLPRFSEWYTIVLEFCIPKGEGDAAAATSHVEQTWSVGQFFDKEGYFDEVGLSQEIAKLFERLEAKQYDGDDGAIAGKVKKEKTK